MTRLEFNTRFDLAPIQTTEDWLASLRQLDNQQANNVHLYVRAFRWDEMTERKTVGGLAWRVTSGFGMRTVSVWWRGVCMWKMSVRKGGGK